MNLNENPELLEREKELDQLHEQMIIYSTRIDWLEKGLKRIRAKILTFTANLNDIAMLIEHTHVPEEKYVRISDVNKEIAEEWRG